MTCEMEINDGYQRHLQTVANNDDVIEHDSSCNSHQSDILFTKNKMRLLFVFMGMGTLFPYNILITCADYFSKLHSDENDVAGQIAASTLSALLITTLLLLLIADDSINPSLKQNSYGSTYESIPGKICNIIFYWVKNSLSSRGRILLGYGCVIIFLFSLSNLPSNHSMGTLNALSFLIGMADATSQSGLYVFAASFEQPSFSAATSLGSAIAGVAVSALRLLTRALFDDNSLEGLGKGTSLLFYIGIIFMLTCILAFFISNRYDNNDQSSRNVNTHNCIMNKETKGDENISAKIANQNETNFCINVQESTNQENLNDNANTEDVWLRDNSLTTSEERKYDDSVRDLSISPLRAKTKTLVPCLQNPRVAIHVETLKIVWKPTLSTFLNFFITLSLFPGTIVSFQSDSSGFVHFGSWLPDVLITIFNLADCLGRAILSLETWKLPKLILEKNPNMLSSHNYDNQVAGHIVLHNYNKFVWIPTFARLLFYPMIMSCLTPFYSTRENSDPLPVIQSDMVKCFIVFLFGISNGYIQCANFFATPTMVVGDEARDSSSLLLLIALFIGLTSGAYFGLLINSLLQI